MSPPRPPATLAPLAPTQSTMTQQPPTSPSPQNEPPQPATTGPSLARRPPPLHPQPPSRKQPPGPLQPPGAPNPRQPYDTQLGPPAPTRHQTLPHLTAYPSVTTLMIVAVSLAAAALLCCACCFCLAARTTAADNKRARAGTRVRRPYPGSEVDDDNRLELCLGGDTPAAAGGEGGGSGPADWGPSRKQGDLPGRVHRPVSYE